MSLTRKQLKILNKYNDMIYEVLRKKYCNPKLDLYSEFEYFSDSKALSVIRHIFYIIREEFKCFDTNITQELFSKVVIFEDIYTEKEIFAKIVDTLLNKQNEFPGLYSMFIPRARVFFRNNTEDYLYVDPVFNNTLLHSAVFTGNKNLVFRLIKILDINIHAKDKLGFTPYTLSLHILNKSNLHKPEYINNVKEIKTALKKISGVMCVMDVR